MFMAKAQRELFGMVSIKARRTLFTESGVEKTAATSGSSTTARLPRFN
jgi:hypothetical protein